MKALYFPKKMILLLLFCIYILSACGKAEETEEEETVPAGTDPQETEESEWYVDDHEEFTLSDGESWDMVKYFGDTEYYVSDIRADGDGSRVCSLNRMTEETSECIITLEADRVIRAYSVDKAGSIYILAYISGEEEGMELLKLDGQGREVFCKAISMADENLREVTLTGAEASEEGFCVMTSKGMLLIWDTNGEEAGCFVPDWYGDDLNALSRDFGLVQGKDGIYVFHRGYEAIYLQGIDMPAASLSTDKEIIFRLGGSSLDGYYSASEWIFFYSSYDQGFYISDANALYLYDDRSQETERILGWSDTYIDIERFAVETIAGMKKEELLLTTRYDRRKVGWSNIKLVKSGEEQEREVIIVGEIKEYGVSNDAELTECIQSFNASQKEYQVQVKEYHANDLAALNLDLLQGNGPDLIRLDRLDRDKYEAKGILEDLGPYFAQSEVLTEDILLPEMLDIMSKDGAIPFVFPAFTINMLVLQERYAEAGAITTKEFLKLASSGGESYLIPETEYDLLKKILLIDKEQYLDWADGSCTFDDGRFAELLELIHGSSLPEKAPGIYGLTPEAAEEFYRGTYMARYDSLMSFYSYLTIRDGFEGIAKITGYPNARGEALYPVTSKGAIGINSASEHKDAAWKFIEYYMHNYADQSSYHLDLGNFRVVKEDFERQLYSIEEYDGSYLSTNPYTGEVVLIQDSDRPVQDIYYDPYTGQPVHMHVIKITEEDREMMRYMVEHAYLIDAVMEKDMDSMFYEEVQSYFSGDKSAEEVAGIIQGKVSLYMSEQVW